MASLIDEFLMIPWQALQAFPPPEIIITSILHHDDPLQHGPEAYQRKISEDETANSGNADGEQDQTPTYNHSSRPRSSHCGLAPAEPGDRQEEKTWLELV
jgi:hypothetical protein